MHTVAERCKKILAVSFCKASSSTRSRFSLFSIVHYVIYYTVTYLDRRVTIDSKGCATSNIFFTTIHRFFKKA